MKDVNELIKEYDIPIVEIDERDYWLVRTQAGEFHEEFYFDNFIAIGWNEFNNMKDFEQPVNEDYMKSLIAKQYKESKQPGLIYNQIKRFFNELSVGDLVMIPTMNSTHISFGRITSPPYIADVNETDIDEGSCPFQKRMDVEWIKTVKRSNLDPYLYKMMHSHHTINKANEYAAFIDRTLHSFYLKNGTAHLVIDIKKKDNLSGLDFFEFGTNIINLLPEVEKLGFISEDFNKRRDVKVKSNVQSPGIVEFISTVPGAILGIGIILTFVVGGKVNASFTKEETKAGAESKGLFGLFLEYKKQKQDHELEKLKLEQNKSMERVNAELPEELKNLPANGEQEDQDENSSS
ncbi:hypothetical protein [Halobacillus litoralis]|uniref:Uncharacterized protein n=1 Tax=Halobacillus litoralis TaxID=45668 RepID=A0A410MDH8_9BACI|nr:hypothetical protein [Halobacillus litoralis]QAS52781.1 hypothetical protein HLI_11535 [Halobacillus litoralis]